MLQTNSPITFVRSKLKFLLLDLVVVYLCTTVLWFFPEVIRIAGASESEMLA